MMEAEKGRREVNIREASPSQNQQFYENPRVNARILGLEEDLPFLAYLSKFVSEASLFVKEGRTKS